MSYYMLSGLGAIDFNADTVWSDFLHGASGDNAAGKRATQTISAALNQLGYGLVPMGGDVGTIGPYYKRFVQENGVTPSPNGAGWPTQAGIIKLGEMVAAGGAPGGQPVVEFHQTPSGQFVSGQKPGTAAIGTAKAGMTGMQMGLLAVAAIVLVGGLAVMSKKKKPGAPGYGGSSGSSAMTVRTVPNRRR